MAKFIFKADSVPETLKDGALEIVDGVVYAGDSNGNAVGVEKRYADLTSKTTPVKGDSLKLFDSEDSNAEKRATITNIRNSLTGYYEFIQELTQTGTNPPTIVNEFIEDVPVEADWEYASVGVYRLQFIESIDFSKLSILSNAIGFEAEDATSVHIYLEKDSANNRLILRTFLNGQLSNSVLDNTYVGVFTINIRLYI